MVRWLTTGFLNVVLRKSHLYPVFGSFPIESQIRGYLLGSIGVLSVILGWNLVKTSRKLIQKHSGRDKVSVSFHTAVFWWLIGCLFLASYVGANTNWRLLESLESGFFRGIEIQEGTGLFFYMGFFALTSSVCLVTLTICWKSNLRLKIIAIGSLIITFLLYMSLGGRARALTPIFAVLIAVAVARKKSIQIRTKEALIVLIIAFVILFYLFFGLMYRGGWGLRITFKDFAEFIGENVEYLVWKEIGHDFALSAITMLPEGILGPFSLIPGPLKELTGLPVESESGGVFLVQIYGHAGKKPWGALVSTVGDIYLAAGVFWAAIICGIFGAIGKLIYSLKPKGYNHPWRASLYGLCTAYWLRIYLEKWGRWFEMFVILICFLTIWMSQKLLESIVKNEF
jgi:oligosaccharide repeat unit polymerase